MLLLSALQALPVGPPVLQGQGQAGLALRPAAFLPPTLLVSTKEAIATPVAFFVHQSFSMKSWLGGAVLEVGRWLGTSRPSFKAAAPLAEKLAPCVVPAPAARST